MESNQQPVITGTSSNTTTDQLLQYLVAINGHNTIQQPLEIQNIPANPATQASQPVNYYQQVPVQLPQAALQKKTQPYLIMSQSH